MTSPTTYSLLVTNITDIAEDDSSEFAAYVPKAINMAEDRLFRVIKLNYSEDTTLNCTIGNPIVNKPNGFREVVAAFIVVSGEKKVLVKRSTDFLKDYWPSDSVRDTPKYYADNDLTTFRIAPTPDVVYTIDLEFMKQPTYLSVSNQSNVFTERYPDLMFYASMVNICEFMKDVERKQEWEQRFQDAMNSVNEEALKNNKEDTSAKVSK